MLDFVNISLRTIMCLAFIAFVVRPMLMSMVRREPNTTELEEMAQLAVNSAFREQFASFYAPKSLPQIGATKFAKDGTAEQPSVQVSSAHAVLSEKEKLVLQAEMQAVKLRQAELLKGHEEEMASASAEPRLPCGTAPWLAPPGLRLWCRGWSSWACLGCWFC